MSTLPVGTVTFLFTDVEGSTRLLEELGAERYADALAAHDDILRAVASRHGGTVVDAQGDAFFVAFATAAGAVAAAVEAQERLAAGRVRVRMGIHTGEPLRAGDGYVGMSVHRAARIAAAGHGGQVLVSDATRQLLDDAHDLHDLGLVRLKDLEAPQRVHQVGHASFPPLRTLDRTNLPVPATAFFGRLAELAQLAAVLRGGTTRLVTLTGAGGAGKTRLALQAAADAADSFPGGVTWVALAEVRDPLLVLPTVVAELGLRGEGREAIETLAVWAPRDRALLLLDNIEQVIDAAPEIAALVLRCPSVTVLVTSREPLRVGAERVVQVGSLEREDAVALFAARARTAEPAFEPTPPVAELCARLDDLPLAIELAAARSRALSVDALLERLSEALELPGARDADPRQRTLRATIAWSHDLLDEDERRLFRRLGVFAGAAPLAAVEEVCEGDLGVLTSLIDKSVVRRRTDAGEDRYWMLETIRAFAVELEASGEAGALADRHAEWYGRHAIELGDGVLQSMGRPGPLVHEVAELRLAFTNLERRAQYELLADACAHSAFYWYFIADSRECIAWLDACAPHVHDGELRGRLDVSRAMLELHFDAARAVSLAEAGLARLEDPVWTALALTTIGNGLIVSDPRRAAEHYERALRLVEAVDATEWTTGLAANAAAAAFELGDLENAERLARYAQRREHDPVSRASAAEVLARVLVRRGDLEEALAEIREALRLARGHVPLWLPGLVAGVAWVRAHAGQLEAGAALEAAAVEQGRRLGWPGADELYDREIEHLVADGLSTPEAERAARLGAALPLAEAVAVALGERDLPPLSG